MPMIHDFYKCDERGDCDRCGNPSSSLRFIGGQATCANCAEDLDALSGDRPLTPQEQAEFDGADTVSELLFTAQELACTACSSTRKTVLSDRWHLGTVGSACCESSLIDPDLGEVA